MATKNTAGNLFVRFKNREKRLLNKIDKREAKGTNRENVDSVYNEHSFTPTGERVWSF